MNDGRAPVTPFVVVDPLVALGFLTSRRTAAVLYQGCRAAVLHAPEIVEEVVLADADVETAALWQWLRRQDRVRLLPDAPTPELSAVTERLAAAPAAQRMTAPADFAPLLSLAHAVVRAAGGASTVVVLGAPATVQWAEQEARRLAPLPGAATLRVLEPLAVLRAALGSPQLADADTLRSVYHALEATGRFTLPPLGRTDLVLRGSLRRTVTREGSVDRGSGPG